jgi:hypothetical protein
VNCSDPVVVASSGPKPSATLHEERRHAAKHDPAMVNGAEGGVKQFGDVPTWPHRERLGGGTQNGGEKADFSLRSK